MSYALWSGFNTGFINDVEINGAAPSPDLLFEGFDGDTFSVLLGGHAGLYADVMRTRAELRSYALQEEDTTFETSRAKTNLKTLHEDRAMGRERSRKDFP